MENHNSRNKDPEIELKKRYLLNIQDDKKQDPLGFFAFFDFCWELSNKDVKKMKVCLFPLGLQLIGPFNAFFRYGLDGDEEEDAKPLSWRYFYDIPEVVTLMRVVNANSQEVPEKTHLCVYRDHPHQLPAGVVSNSPTISCEFKFLGDNLFQAVIAHLKMGEKASNSSKKEPSKAAKNIEKKMIRFAAERKISLEGSPRWKARKKMIVANDFTGLGIVVPYNKSTELGYRQLPCSTKQLQNIFKRLQKDKADSQALEELTQAIHYVNIANDESDFGTSLHFGRNLFTADIPSQKLFAKPTKSLLTTAYKLLGRDEFVEVLISHLENRV